MVDILVFDLELWRGRGSTWIIIDNQTQFTIQGFYFLNNSITFLGVIIDDKLKWTAHIY